MFYQDHILQGPSAVSAYICVEKIDNHTLISSFFISFISSSEASAKSNLKTVPIMVDMILQYTLISSLLFYNKILTIQCCFDE